jgi:DNA-binding CsgD family transcriptional regulator
LASTLRHQELLEREGELGAIESALGAALKGDGRAVLVTGDPGIGKTSLLGAAADSASRQGFQILSVRADALEVQLSFGVCAQLFLGLTDPPPGGDTPELFAGAAANSRPIFGGTAGVPQAISEDRTMSLIHGLYWLCANLADSDPLLLVIDDAHWADLPSLRFMNYLTRRLDGLRAVLLAAARPAERGTNAGDLLATLVADGNCVTLEPSSLSADAVTRLVSGELGNARPELSEACHRLSGGNPLYLRELLRSASESGLEASGDAEALADLRPEGVAESVLARLAGLGDESRRLAEVAAVGGGRLPLRGAAELAGIDVDAGRRAADALVGAAILDGGEPLRFAHPLVQGAVYGSVSDAELAGLHLQVADLLRKGGAPRKVFAVHLLNGERGGGEWVVDDLELAAGEEMAQGSPDGAARFLRRALEEELPEDRRGRLLVTLGLAETEAGNMEGAERLTAAVDLLPSPEERAGVLLALGTATTLQARVTEATTAYERGLEEIAGIGGPVARDLESMFTIGLNQTRDGRAAALPRLEALIADPEIDRSATGRALLAHAASERAYQGTSLDELRQLAARAIAPGLDEDDPMAFWAYFFCAYAYEDSDDFERADRASARALELARARGSAVQAAAACHPRSFLNLRRGDVEAAVADAQTSVEGAERGWRAGLPSGISVLGEALLERGEMDRAVAVCQLPGGDERWTRLISYMWLLDSRARIDLERGDAASALSQLLECGEMCEASQITNPSVLAWRSGAALAASSLGELDQARELAETELGWARGFGTPRAIGVAERTLALVTGDDESIERLREAVELLETSRARVEHSRTLVELGAALRRAGHRKESRGPLREGLDMAHRCGAVLIAERAKEELSASGARPRRVELTGVESLTPSERRIATMASEGLSNPQIAQALFLTRRTVEMHLTNAYRKLDIGSRDDLPAALGSDA